VSGGFDLAVLGSGFGGSLLAMAARRLGLRVLLLERSAHPRFAIGESTSPLANLLLEELSQRFDLPRLMPFATYGTWKQTYPEVAVGLKRGFTFYQHQEGRPYGPDPQRERQLMVAASPYDEVADTHWYRPDFDHFLVREAQELGVEYVDRVAISGVCRDGESTSLEGEREGRRLTYRARFVVDASGPRGALSRLFALPESSFAGFPRTQALFTHFRGVDLFAPLGVPRGETPPYPPDDAALHHVFGGGWMWVLRFENGITSAGFAVEDAMARDLRLEDRDGAWQRFLDRFPSIRQQFEGAEPVLPFFRIPRLSYRCEQMAGPGWAMLPSAAAFIDPLFSTGFPLTLLGIHRLGSVLHEAWGTPSLGDRLREYAAVTSREAETAALLVGASYACFEDFPAFADLSMLYFTAASYSEMARRLGRPDLASEFLLQNQMTFRSAFRRHCEAARRGDRSGLTAIAADAEPVNIAGLSDPGKRNWYDVDLNDVVRGAAKLQLSPASVRAFFQQMGWLPEEHLLCSSHE
jgi:FADH2 O2-dependent halogenase